MPTRASRAYDHPKGLIFENVERFDADTIRSRILDAAGDPKPVGLLLSEDDLRAQRAGGTWTDIVDPDGIGSKMPVIAWLVVMQLMALAILPVALAVFRSLPDRGYLLAKLLGILVVSLVAWMLASLQWMAFSFGAVVVGIGAVALASCVVLVFTWSSFWSFFRERWRVIAICELVFIVAFLAFVAVRMANPDLWHQWQGGEKPMDTAYLNAVLKSSFMPPYDPWYAGGYLNYYYWGQFIVASFIHMTGIDTAVAVNLAVPMFFALTVGGAFSVVYNLAEAARAKLSQRPAHRVPDEPSLKRASAFAWSPVLAGVAAALFVTVIGNLDGAIQSLENLFSFLLNEPLREFDFWRSSRLMPPDPPGNEITEFPFFTFLFADLHAHLMALPFTILVVGVALAVVLRARDPERGSGRLAGMGWGMTDVVQVAVLGVAVGALRPLNTWDYPTYLLLSMAAVLLAGVLRNGGLNLPVMFEAAVKRGVDFPDRFRRLPAVSRELRDSLFQHRGYHQPDGALAVLADRRPVRVRHRLVCGHRVAQLALRSGTNRLASLLQTRCGSNTARAIRSHRYAPQSNRQRASRAGRGGSRLHWACGGAEAGGDNGQYDAVRVRAPRPGAGDGVADRVLLGARMLPRRCLRYCWRSRRSASSSAWTSSASRVTSNA